MEEEMLGMESYIEVHKLIENIENHTTLVKVYNNKIVEWKEDSKYHPWSKLTNSKLV